MAEYIWCHGTECHTSRTQDRVRGSKGSKVLRTIKLKQETERRWYSPYHVYNYFCSQTCLHNFIGTHIQRSGALDPRHEPLETPIEDPVREKSEYGYYNTTINERGVDNE